MTFPPHVNSFTAVAEAFMKAHPEIEIKIEAQADISTKIKSGIASGVLADLFMVRAEDFYEYVASGGLAALPADVLSKAELEKDFWPEFAVQAPFPDVYAVGVADPPGDAGFVVNLDMFEEAGLEVPGRFADLAELVSYAQKLTEKDADGNLTRAGLSCREGNNPVYMWSFIVDQGGEFYNNDSQKFDFSIPESKKALQFFYDLNYKYEVDSVNMPATFDALSQQVAAMGFMWAEYIPYSRINFPDSNFGFVVKPPFSGNKAPAIAHNDTWNLGANAKSPNKEQAIKFLGYLKTVEAQRIFLDKNPGIPPLKSMLDDPFFETDRGKFLKALTDIVPKTKFYGPFGNASIIRTNTWAIMDEVIHESITVEEALTELTKQNNHALDVFDEKYPQYKRPVVQY